MLFLTTGTHEPFDRLVKAVDDWAARRPDVEVFGQVAGGERQHYKPNNFPWVSSLSAGAFREKVEATEIIVGHAGMGSIISALSANKPILILPRRGHLHETRNDHQFATALKFQSKRGIYVALDEDELPEKLDAMTRTHSDKVEVESISPQADAQLISVIRNLIFA